MYSTSIILDFNFIFFKEILNKSFYIIFLLEQIYNLAIIKFILDKMHKKIK